MSIASTINIKAPVVFRSWNGEELTATLTSLVYDQKLPGQEKLNCNVKVTLEVMTRIYDEQWFHLNGQTMLQDVHFENDGEIELLLVLSPSVTAEISRLNWDIDTVLKALIEDRKPNLSSASQWFLTEATQSIGLPEHISDHGQLKIGFFTTWKQMFGDAHATKSTKLRMLDEASSEHMLISEQESADGLLHTNKASSLVQQVEEELKQRELTYQWHNEAIVAIPIASERHIKWTELICIEQDASLVIVYAVIPQPIPVELRKETAEWLMGINYELMNGAFEMDSSDGELRFRSTILCPDGLLQESVLSQIFADHEEIMNHYIPAISEML